MHVSKRPACAGHMSHVPWAQHLDCDPDTRCAVCSVRPALAGTCMCAACSPAPSSCVCRKRALWWLPLLRSSSSEQMRRGRLRRLSGLLFFSQP